MEINKEVLKSVLQRIEFLNDSTACAFGQMDFLIQEIKEEYGITDEVFK